jgi:hypothetical protein
MPWKRLWKINGLYWTPNPVGFAVSCPMKENVKGNFSPYQEEGHFLMP